MLDRNLLDDRSSELSSKHLQYLALRLTLMKILMNSISCFKPFLIRKLYKKKCYRELANLSYIKWNTCKYNQRKMLFLHVL